MKKVVLFLSAAAITATATTFMSFSDEGTTDEQKIQSIVDAKVTVFLEEQAAACKAKAMEAAKPIADSIIAVERAAFEKAQAKGGAKPAVKPTVKPTKPVVKAPVKTPTPAPAPAPAPKPAATGKGGNDASEAPAKAATGKGDAPAPEKATPIKATGKGN